MPSTPFNNIMSALESHLSGINLNIDFVWQNVKIDPDQTKEYVYIDHLFGQTVQACMGDDGKDETNGIFQVSIMTPLNTGRSSIIDQIANRFKRGTVLKSNITKVRIVSVSKEAPFYDINHYRQPLSIRWQVFSKSR